MTHAEAPTPRGGIRLGRVAGVPVHIGPSWFLMALFLTVTVAQAVAGTMPVVQTYVVGGSFALLLGSSVLLHELGHCLVARAFGLPVRRITIGFMAGATEITEPPQTPGREYAVAVAGPMVSLLLAGVGLGLLPLFDKAGLTWHIVENLAITNGLIAAFNLLPGLPLDGGRVLRALIWKVRGDADSATVAAAWAGRVVAVAVVPLLFVVVLPAVGYGSRTASTLVFAALIAAYVYTLATATLRRQQALNRLPSVSAASLGRPALRVAADVPVSEAVRQAQEARAGGLVVVDGADRVEAVVSEAAVLATPLERRPWVAIGTLARRVSPDRVLDAALTGEQLLAAMQAHPAPEYVTQDRATGELKVLVADDVAKALSA